jgi:hypothetical protein
MEVEINRSACSAATCSDGPTVLLYVVFTRALGQQAQHSPSFDLALTAFDFDRFNV